MKKIQLILASIIAVVGVASTGALFASAPVVQASAVDSITNGINQTGGQENKVSLQDNIKTISNILMFILGAAAVIMIIIGGIRYTTSNGDSSSVKGAKDTVLYSIVGLVVALMAYAIVNFVVVTAFGGK